MPDTDLFRSPDLLCRHRSRVLVVDVQEKLLPTIDGGPELLRRCRFVLDGAAELQVPVIVSEQYPQGLGPTVPALAEHAAVCGSFSKVRFSAAPALCEAIALPSHTAPEAHDGRDQIVLVGMEAHVCVLQTALDLLARGFQVIVAADATGSGTSTDHATAMQRLQAAGVTVCSVESVVFEWCATAEADEFRNLSRLIRDLRSSTP